MAQTQNIRIRYATFRDVPSLAQLAISAFATEKIVNYIYCYREQYPEDNVYFWEERLRNDLFDPSVAFLVAELSRPGDVKCDVDGDGQTTETIVAFGIWRMKGECRHGTRKVSRKERVVTSMMYMIRQVEGSVMGWMYGKRRDMNKQRLQAFMEAKENFFQDYKNLYHLDLLGTKAEYRRLGAGTALVQWAIDRATADGAFIGLEPSEESKDFYRKRGFVPIGEFVVRDPEEAAKSFDVSVIGYSREEKSE